MTVGELMERLAACDQALPVRIEGCCGGCSQPVAAVEVDPALITLLADRTGG